jgi:hypothetical protein
MGRFLKESGKSDKTRAGKMMTAVGKSLSYSGQQRLTLRMPLLRLYQVKIRDVIGIGCGTIIFGVFIQSFQANVGIKPKLRHGCFHPEPFQFNVYVILPSVAVWSKCYQPSYNVPPSCLRGGGRHLSDHVVSNPRRH